ncbi:MAG TPA: DUF1376 domain-containing protein [Acidobacteriaceae bacterium]|jgi:uncharacterized protein YdaU (DUF1376 family)|nr:DUF1376 domain-containing protein [Acidobacteriaceae bacterium]
MSKSSSPFQSKVDVFMPLYIGRYLQDTTELDGAESGFYLHLLMHIWTTGPLPNDDRKLAQIAKTTPDAWSIASASVKHRLFLGSDGMLHQRGAERIKAEWVEKRLKAHEKAQLAANTRWKKYREQKANKNDAPSIARAMPYNGKVQVQKQKQTPPTPPQLRQGGPDAPHTGVLQASARRTSRPAAAGAPGGRSAAMLGGKVKQIKGETARNAPRTRPNRQVEGIHPKNVGDGGAIPHLSVAPGAKKVVQPQKTDPRERAFQEEIFAYWRGQNPEHPDCPWGEAEWRALRALLIKVADLSLGQLRTALRNRAASGIPPGVFPGKWLRNILDYSSGPLDRFHKPLRSSRVM